MNKEELKIKLTELFPAATCDESGEWLNITIAYGDLLSVAEILRNNPELNFDYLFCQTCIDWKTHLTMVYHLESTKHRHQLVLKAQLDRNKPEIETVSHIWRTADFHEREVYEMFGVNFLNHPDLRLLILPDGWEGRNPMRKDFEDTVNMIRL
ncbi:MAG TPA: NADH-quinone oxidoreductase subunit C [Chitinophagaceae bacterium]|nr:NADH-quinone oxidoreductase subunit C [Chitinophagaceae bacterium]